MNGKPAEDRDDQHPDVFIHLLVRCTLHLHLEQLRQTPMKHAARMRGVVRSERTLSNALLENRRENPQEARTSFPPYLAALIRLCQESDEALMLYGIFPGRAENLFQFLRRGQFRGCRSPQSPGKTAPPIEC